MIPKSPPDITVFDIADWFLAQAKSENKPLKHMKLQKLVYFAYGWYCAYYDDPLLFKENFYACRLGIIVKDLYERYQHCGGSPIIVSSLDCPIFDENVVDILKSVWKAYSPCSDYTLHRVMRNHPAWRQSRRSFELEFIISPKTIRESFKELMIRNAHAEK